MRFSPMMRSAGYTVIHYGNAGAVSGANEQVDVLSQEETEYYLGKHDPAAPAFYEDRVNTSSRLYQIFNSSLHRRLGARVEPGDVLCYPFGNAHADALVGPCEEKLKQVHHVEIGVGYEETFCSHVVFDSYAWMHWHLGKKFQSSPANDRQRNGSDYNWVIRNYFDLEEWTPEYQTGKYLAYLGRICDAKGLRVIVEIAKALPDTEIVICGQGDPKTYTSQADNITYKAPIWGKARSEFLAGASALLTPTRYVEPFGLVAVEAMLSGTPVLASPYGGFTETVRPGVTGYLCHTLGDWLVAIESAKALDRRVIRREVESYDMYKVASEYHKVFQQVTDLGHRGWFTRRKTTTHASQSEEQRA